MDWFAPIKIVNFYRLESCCLTGLPCRANRTASGTLKHWKLQPNKSKGFDYKVIYIKVIYSTYKASSLMFKCQTCKCFHFFFPSGEKHYNLVHFVWFVSWHDAVHDVCKKTNVISRPEQLLKSQIETEDFSEVILWGMRRLYVRNVSAFLSYRLWRVTCLLVWAEWMKGKDRDGWVVVRRTRVNSHGQMCLQKTEETE